MKVLNIGLIILLFFAGCVAVEESTVHKAGQDSERQYIYDRTGYKWDVTQAASIGFKPDEFQYGIGKDTFVTLDDSLLDEGSSYLPDSLRVIGVEGEGESKAYSVGKLTRHEISNSSLDGKPVAVGY